MKPEDANLEFVFPESDPGYPARSNELLDVLSRSSAFDDRPAGQE